jgi:ABC-type lipoprotein release transport system permease subunit
MSDTSPSNERPLTTGEWFVTILVLALPIIGIVMHFVWAFSDGNVNRRNFCRAALLWFAVGVALGILALITVVVFFGGLAALAHHGGR